LGDVRLTASYRSSKQSHRILLSERVSPFLHASSPAILKRLASPERMLWNQ